MNMEKTRLCRADAADAYHRAVKLVALPAIGAYCLHAIAAGTQHVTGSNATGLVSTGADSGLEMTLMSPMPQWLVVAHSRGAIALCFLVFLQKELVRGMAQNLVAFRAAHTYVGYLTLLALFIMDAAGYLLSAFSAFERFQLFAVFFALPFALWLVGLYATARAGWWRAHAFLANMLLKGCIATPLSRLGGAALQRRGWDRASGYYQGIFGVALIIALWQAADCLSLWRELRLERRQEAQKHTTQQSESQTQSAASTGREHSKKKQ